MKQINLLPWREQLRETQKRQFLQMLVVAFGFALVVIIILHVIVAGRIREQMGLNALLQQQVDEVTVKTKEIQGIQEDKAGIINRMTVIRDLQAARPVTVYVFNELTRIMPDGVFLTNIQRVGDNITLTGKAESNTRVSMLMRNIEASKWLMQPVLSEIKTVPNQKPYTNDFLLVMQPVIRGFNLNAYALATSPKDTK